MNISSKAVNIVAFLVFCFYIVSSLFELFLNVESFSSYKISVLKTIENILTKSFCDISVMIKVRGWIIRRALGINLSIFSKIDISFSSRGVEDLVVLFFQ
jgi:hypothetical protein